VAFFTKHFEKLNSDDVRKADKIIVCGTSLKDNYFLEKKDCFNWLKNNEKPVFGICAGMQLLALLYGGRIVFSEEIGLKEYFFKNGFFGLLGKKTVYMLHRNAVDLSEAIDLKSIAGKDYCVAFKHKEKEVYGVLFHPEVRNQELIARFALA